MIGFLHSGTVILFLHSGTVVGFLHSGTVVGFLHSGTGIDLHSQIEAVGFDFEIGVLWLHSETKVDLLHFGMDNLSVDSFLDETVVAPPDLVVETLETVLVALF